MKIGLVLPEWMYWIAGIFIVLGVAMYMYSLWVEVSEKDAEAEKPKYIYRTKKSFITAAERDFYNALGQAVGKDYRIFAQVHLGSMLSEQIPGQDWRAARAHINRKSVDFLLCDKNNLAPILAIELDDSSHDRQDRKERDIEVERILKEAGLPLLRVQNSASFDPQKLTIQVKDILS